MASKKNVEQLLRDDYIDLVAILTKDFSKHHQYMPNGPQLLINSISFERSAEPVIYIFRSFCLTLCLLIADDVACSVQLLRC